MPLTCKNTLTVTTRRSTNNLQTQPFIFPNPFFSKPLKRVFTTPPHPVIHCNQTNNNNTNNTTNKRPLMSDNNDTKSPTRKKPIPRRRKSSSYGSSRKSVLKKSFTQEQVVFSAPVSNDPVVGIIGGGMSGLVCALYLEKRGIKSTVFDTGIHGLGGRMGTRMIDPQPLIFDHAAQFFTVSDPKFAELVDIWCEEGLVRQWEGTVGKLEAGGKCANQLLASSGLPLIAGQMKRLELSSIWALLAAFEDPLPMPANVVPFEGAFVKGVDSVSWMADNTKKLFGSCSNGPCCWTIFSTEVFGKQNKVPQESIPNAKAERVKEAMLHGVEDALGLSRGSLNPFYTRVQLWGAALPTNTPGIPCIFDPHGRAGICGDWLLGSSLEAAALSGMALANHIADFFHSCGSCPDEFAIGLHSKFQFLKGHDIGQFPGLQSEEQLREPQALQLST